MENKYLYVVKRTIVNPKNPIEEKFDVALPATFTILKAAKEKAREILFDEGYEKDFFPTYDINDGQRGWKHGDGVIVYARGPSHETFKVEIEAVPNPARFEADDDGRVRHPLHFVLQTIIHYNEDRSGSIRESIIESVHMGRKRAKAQALKVLLDKNIKKTDFAEYDEYVESEGPFGPDVIVHAVKDQGENVLISVVSDYHT